METKKNPPVDRGKLLKGLASCAILGCKDCPYKSNCAQQGIDAIAYIGYLEHVLEEALGHDA